MGLTDYKNLSATESQQLTLNAISAIQATKNGTAGSGWTELTASQLGYGLSASGTDTTFLSEDTSTVADSGAHVLVKRDASGAIVDIALVFDEGNSPQDRYDIENNFIADTLLTPDPTFEPTYVTNAYSNLLTTLADFMSLEGLAASDLLVTGFSLGGAAAMNLAQVLTRRWAMPLWMPIL
ncbi:hypothetical protein [Halocynthiibacter namhaensis]|uniref:hypothetical protein n=1 Tax=Halocynthiibacter namhaensis TaxID=1290553 RepID=UPI000578ED16|nr:hypothetical protein [Halocynthiibacter namhaensis]